LAQLSDIIEEINENLSQQNSARDEALRVSRGLIRMCSRAIRAAHREEWDQAAVQLSEAKKEAHSLIDNLSNFPDLYYSGYTQDALKEYVEAHLTIAFIRDEPLPSPKELGVEPATYLSGLVEATTELRRRILDIIRHKHSDEAERLLEVMDSVYGEMITLDFPDAITQGLRRRTDVLRGVLERTRGDLTNSLRQQRLQKAIHDLEFRLGERESTSGEQ